MLKQSKFILALILLITVNACAGADVESETPGVSSTQSPIEVESPSTQPNPASKSSTSKASSGPKTPNSSASAESKKNQVSSDETSNSPAAPPQTSKQQVAVTPEPPLPKLSPEKEKLVSKITKEEKKKADFITQNSGITTVNRVLIAQQAMWLISGSFSTDFKALEPNLPSETDEYQFKITQGDQSEAVVVAIAKSNKLPSFAGATVAVPAGIPQSGLCQTKLPSQQAPTPPKIENGLVQCGNDGVLVDSVTP